MEPNAPAQRFLGMGNHSDILRLVSPAIRGQTTRWSEAGDFDQETSSVWDALFQRLGEEI